MIRIKNIVCPVDFFPASLRAFDYALKFAQDNGATVHAIHIVTPVIPTAYDFAFDTSGLIASFQRESKRQMQKLVERANKSDVRLNALVTVGEIEPEILKMIEKSGADLVVMGTHGRHGFERWFMGSVAERLSRHCPVPLLTIPPVAKKQPVPRRKKS